MKLTHNAGKDNRAERGRIRSLLKHCWIGLLTAGLAGICAFAYPAGAAETSSRPAKQGSSRPQTAAPVAVAAAKTGDIGVFLTGLGSVTPLNTVTVKTRVDGQLMRVVFHEGETVKSGALLAEIDSRPFEAQLTQAEGQLARDQALLENARLDLQRYETLSKQDSIARQQYDTQKSLVHQLEGTVKFDQGQVAGARVQLTYCRITAPLGGRMGLRLVDPGNIVHASDTTGLAVITQLQPISVLFPLPEDSIPSVLKKLNTGARMPVEAYDREDKHKLATGYLLTLDNQIDPNTGTVRLKAVFHNKDNELFPNQFVNARLLLDMRRGVVVVPSAAIQRSAKESFVYVVKEDRTVEVRPVSVGPGEGDLVSIENGLKPGELVVVEGSERLREGSKVEVQTQGADSSGKGK